MNHPIPLSRVARAMGDDEMMAVHCDDRPNLAEQLRIADYDTRPDPESEGIEELTWGELLVMLVVVSFIGFLLAAGGL